MTTYYQTESIDSLPLHEFTDLSESECRRSLGKFKSALTSYAFFHLSFLLLALLQLTATIVLAMTIPTSPLFAISLATLLLTACSYLILTYYFQGKKPLQFDEIVKQYYYACLKHLPVEVSDADYHLSIAHSMFQLATYIGQKQVYALSFKPFSFLEELFLSIGYHLHFKDLLMMQEILMHRSIEEHVELIKKNPTDLAVHTSLANAYTALAKLYKKPSDLPFKVMSWHEKRFTKSSYVQKFEQATKRAIEELKILDDLAPNDPWVHAQLASCYHHLEMFPEEIHEYEILLNIRPHDREILYRLGSLYFRLGKNAKGLSIYQSLKDIDARDAAHLITHWSM